MPLIEEIVHNSETAQFLFVFDAKLRTSVIAMRNGRFISETEAGPRVSGTGQRELKNSPDR